MRSVTLRALQQASDNSYAEEHNQNSMKNNEHERALYVELESGFPTDEKSF